MSNSPEIAALNKIFIDHNVFIKFSPDDFLVDNKNYRKVDLSVEGKEFNFYVEDEYDDIQFNYPLLNLCLVLRELEDYKESEDYLIWCQHRYLEPKNEKVLAHFKNLATIYAEIESLIGSINSQVSNWDFEMGSGAKWELRKLGTQ